MANAVTTKNVAPVTRTSGGVNAGMGVLALVTAWYVWTTSGTAYWLDSSELSAAGWTLGIPHPPGHPLHVLLVRIFGALPLGPIAFKAHLLSALCGGLAAWMGFQLTSELLLRNGGTRASRSLLAASATLLACASGAMWLQSVRAEVYTLQTFLALTATWMTVRWDRAHRSGESGWWQSLSPLLIVALTVGLGLANHHYLMAWVIPVPLFLLLTRQEGRNIATSRSVLPLLGVGALGLLPYLFLPIRSAADPVINWASPDTWERFVDTVSARVFHASVTASPEGQFFENLLGVATLLQEQMTPLCGILAVIGVLVMTRRTPRAAAWWTVAVLGNVASVCIMDFDGTNPDTWGYLQFTHFLVAAACAVALLELTARFPGKEELTGATGIVLLLLMTAASAAVQAPRSLLKDFNAPQITEDAILREVPPGGVLMTSFFSAFFQHWHAQLVDGRRPDIVIFNQTFDRKIHDGTPYVEAMKSREPQLASLFDAFLETRQFPREQALTLARTEPVFVEPELNGPVPHIHLQQRGLTFQVSSAEPREDRGIELQSRLLGTGGELRETRTFLFWHRFHSTLALLGGGSLEAARREFTHLNALAPGSSRVQEIGAWFHTLETSSPETRAHMRRTVTGVDFEAWYRGDSTPFRVEPPPGIH